ncbi:MAG: ADP compounds hydrolase NudE [Acidiferrobacterales bacterium]
MPNKPIITSTRTLAETRLFRVEELNLRFSSGVEVTYERVLGSPYGAVMVVPLLDDNTVLLIREYAAGTERYELTLPKGRIEKDENPIDAANREIMEEVGYGARRLTRLKSLTEAPGYLRHETHLVVAEDLYAQKHEGDEPEEIEVVPWRLDDLDNLWSHTECTEARTIAALFLVRYDYHRKEAM